MKSKKEHLKRARALTTYVEQGIPLDLISKLLSLESKDNPITEYYIKSSRNRTKAT